MFRLERYVPPRPTITLYVSDTYMLDYLTQDLCDVFRQQIGKDMRLWFPTHQITVLESHDPLHWADSNDNSVAMAANMLVFYAWEEFIRGELP